MLSVLAAVWLGAVAGAGAHPAYLTAAEITVEPDGTFHGQVRFDTLAFALNDTSARIGNEPMDELLAGPKNELEAQLTGARERFRGAFRVVTNAGDASLEHLDFPDAAAVLAWRGRARPVLPVVIPVRVDGRLPAGARTVAIRFPPVLEQVILTIQRPGEEPEAQPVEAGAVSTALAVQLDPPKTTFASKKEASGGSVPHPAPKKRPGLLVSFGTLFLLTLLGFLARKRRTEA